MLKKQIILVAAVLVGLFTCQTVLAGMNLDAKQSLLSFTSIKKGKVAEVHTFKDISGSLSEDGALAINIKLVSVETKIAVRNERMQTMLFEVSKFPTAVLTANVGSDFPAGEIKTVAVDAKLALHGKEVAMKIEAVVSRVGKKLLVSSLKPVILNVADFGLNEGVDKLMTVAKLPSIARSIPVNFVLIFH
jgi:polyisoprenoid-binding protein YceI